MAFKFGDVTRNLPTKGFAVDPASHHPYLYFYRDGRRTRFYTYVSHGKSGDDVGDDIVRSMKLQLGLGTMQQVRDLVECPMDRTQYLNALIASNKVPAIQPATPQPPKPAGKKTRKR